MLARLFIEIISVGVAIRIFKHDKTSIGIIIFLDNNDFLFLLFLGRKRTHRQLFQWMVNWHGLYQCSMWWLKGVSCIVAWSHPFLNRWHEECHSEHTPLYRWILIESERANTIIFQRPSSRRETFIGSPDNVHNVDNIQDIDLIPTAAFLKTSDVYAYHTFLWHLSPPLNLSGRFNESHWRKSLAVFLHDCV